MMSLLNRQLLSDLGIQLKEEDYVSLADHFDTTLHERVINEIVQELSPEQAKELAQMQGTSDEALLEWLQTNVENLSEIVSDEVDILLGELAESSEAIGG